MNKRARGAKRPLTYLTGVLLAMMTSSTTMALGLGDIRVLSGAGQPLLAEIAVISADPTELENLRVGLASPATFARIGLAPPEGLVQALQFELTRDARGRAVIRVTSTSPVDVASVGFLIEADWGQGRLVREYSALVDAPTSARAVSEPEIAAPAAALPSTIVRERIGGGAAAATVPRTAQSPARPPAQAQAQPAASSAVDADGRLTVQRGQTLYRIADTVARENDVVRDAAMIALLRANPDAFIRGNLNLLRQGAVLRVPARNELQAIDAAQAAILVREHSAQWRQGRVIAQPATAASAAPAAPAASTTPAPGARLEIAPAAAAAAAKAGTTTGTGEGNEGDMLANEQLRQAREDLATRDAEIDELKQRVAELESLQKQQQALVAMKNTELAQAQAQLAQQPNNRDPGTPWYWFGLPLLLVVLLATWLARRRKPSPVPRDAPAESELATVAPVGAGLDAVAERAPWTAPVEDDAPFVAHALQAPAVDDSTAAVAADDGADIEVPAPWVPVAAVQASAPHVTAVTSSLRDDSEGDDVVPSFARHAERQAGYRGVFEAPADTGPALDDVPEAAVEPVDASTADPAISAAHDRLELAIAYMDLGESRTARLLLEEVAETPDPQLQARARDLLNRLS